MELVSEKKLVLKAVYFSREDSATTGISTLKKIQKLQSKLMDKKKHPYEDLYPSLLVLVTAMQLFTTCCAA